jgi:hypothetical protein
MEIDNTSKKYRIRLKQLREERQTWVSHWHDIVDHLVPRSGRYLLSDTERSNDGQKKHQKILNSSSGDALRTIAAGLQGGLTSPSRPWFTLRVQNEKLMETASVRDWCHEVRDRMLTVFAQSNFYGSVHSVYEELAAFGTSAMLIEEDFDDVIRCRPFTIGEYYLALDSKYRPDTLYRQFSMTARQLVEEFGEENVTDVVKNCFNTNQSEKRFEIVHAIQKNKGVKADKKDASGKLFESIYYELQAPEDKFLRRSGYDTIPFVAPRWKINGVDIYGSCPAMDALGDIKMLQKMEEKKLKALDKLIDPPMNAPSTFKGKGGTIIPGGINYIDPTAGGQSFQPAYQINPDFQKMVFAIQQVEERIKDSFFNKLFLSVLQSDKSMTATEVAERHTEKMVVLGPILERLQSELLGPIIDRVFSIMLNLNLLPEPPQEMQGQELKIDYISLLAQAQKSVGTTSLTQLANFVGALAQIKPEVVDKFNGDEAIDQFGDMVGAPPKVVNSDDMVEAMRAQKAKQAQAMQMAQMAQGAAQTGKVLSETQLGQGTALDSLNQMLGGNKTPEGGM